ncbi:unnamed protein product [Victoria cruziana]
MASARRTGKRKGNPYPLLPPDVGDNEIQVSDDDFEFLKENRDYAGFLKKLDTKSITRHVARLADDEKDDSLEILYEKRRKVAIEPTEEGGHRVRRVGALPIKTLEGKLCYRTAMDETVGSQNLVKDFDPKTGGNVVESETMIKKPTKALRRQQLKDQKKQERAEAKEQQRSVSEEKTTSEVLESVREQLSVEDIFEKKKSKLAEIGTSLLVDPEKNISSLKELLAMCNDDNKTIVKLGLLSLLAVFKDIIPGYRIRLPTEKELQMVVSKEVKRMRYYESMLLNSYRVYLQKLITLEKQSFFHHVTVHSLCCLLEAVPHFNLRESLLDIVVRKTNSSDDVTRKLCCNAVKSLFLNEGKHGGEATVQAVELVSDLVKSHDCQIHPDCIEVFLSLSFDEVLTKAEPVKEEEKINRKRRRAKHGKADERKINGKKQMKHEVLPKAQDEVNADFRAVSFVPDQSERQKMQTQTLSAVFGTYFRILKQIMRNAVSRSHPVLGSVVGAFASQSLLLPCLRGLGKFSHLIGIDFLGDLLNCLKILAAGRGILTVAERLQCCVAAFRIMKNNIDALNVDLQVFFVQLYNLIFEYSPDRENLGGLLAEALKVILYEDRQHDMHRAAAFIKRLATFCLCFGSGEAMMAMVTLRHLLQKNSKCQNLLENDGGGGSLAGPIAKYHPDASDPNMSGALTSVLWELSLLGKHYHPAVSAMASSISSMNVENNQIYLSTLTPQQAFTDYSIDQEKFIGLTNPPNTIRNRKRGSRSSTFLSAHTSNQEIVDDKLIKRFSEHFEVLRDITDNVKLRKELDHTLSSLHLYKKYRKRSKSAQ